MANAYDPYREALVVETETRWPDKFDGWEPEDRARIEYQLHSQPERANNLDYTRLHTGFCRVIEVSDEDIERLR